MRKYNENSWGGVIGTGISCGVDSLTTIYDNFIDCDDIEYKINSLFLFNCGTHGDFENLKTSQIFEARYRLNKQAADDLGLPVIQVNSNLHEFTHKIGEQKVGYFSIYSCVLFLEKGIRKYYCSSSLSYNEILENHTNSHDFDMAEFCESFMIPLLSTEDTELISDGCQYKRTEKTERIKNWDIAKKHLNVCVNTDETGNNCSICSKCARTLIALEALEKLEDFNGVFDINKWEKHKYEILCDYCLKFGEDPFVTDALEFAKKHNMKIPTKKEAKKHYAKMLNKEKRSELLSHILHLPNRVLRKIVGATKYEEIKNKLKK